MIGYKGFDKDFACRGMKFEIGKEYHEEASEICKSGFHACEMPLDVFVYYNPASSRFGIVEIDGDIKNHKEDSKFCGKDIKVINEITLNEMIKSQVEKIKDNATNTGDQSAATNTGDQSAATNTGDQSAATNTGDRSAATNTGDQSAATNTGDQSAATNTGDQSAATNTGDRSAATNTGYQSAATNTGDQSAATNTGNQSAATNIGYQSAATNTGDQSAATNTGYQSAAIVEGKESIAISVGLEGKAKGKIGCWLVLAEWNIVDGIYHRTRVQIAFVDGKDVLEDKFYILRDNKIVEADQ